MTQDFIHNGVASGDIADKLVTCNGDTGVLRPWRSRDTGNIYVTLQDGYRYDNNKDVTVNGQVYSAGDPIPVFKNVLMRNAPPMVQNQGQQLIGNADATLLKDEWIQLDKAVIRAARERLRAWGDLTSSGLTYGGFNGMAKSTIEHQTQSTLTPAQQDMNGDVQGDADRPVYELVSIPLPITHKAFSYSAREITISRNGNMPLDTSSAELAGREVADLIEQTVIGTVPAFGSGANGTVYGYVNFPSRITKTDVPLPTGLAGDYSSVVTAVIQMVQLATDAFHYGPYMLYYSTDWSEFMDSDYVATTSTTITLRERLRQIDEVTDVRRLDFLKAATNPFTFVLVQMTSNVVQAVNGMGITTVQWDTLGGMRKNFKVMAIQIPRLRADYNGNTGIVHGTTS